MLTPISLLHQVHQLDEQTLKDVEVVPIDIANKDEVAPGVSLTSVGGSDWNKQDVSTLRKCLVQHVDWDTSKKPTLSDPVFLVLMIGSY